MGKGKKEKIYKLKKKKKDVVISFKVNRKENTFQ